MARGTLHVEQSTNAMFVVELERLANMTAEGWWSGDLHVHRPLKEIELLMRAEDLHVAPVITWWNNQNLWTNQTPPERLLVRFDRNRWYHIMGGEDEREGGALLYFGLSRPLEIAGAGREYPSPMTFLAAARRHKGVWVDIEKPFWWDAPTWLAGGQCDSVGLANNHMCRDQMYESEAWGRARDAGHLPPPRGNGFWTQEIYYHLLNCGLRIPPSAGSASGVLPNPVGYNRVYVHCGRRFTWNEWWEALRAGRSFVSNGPLLRCRANGKLPGHIFKAQKGGTFRIQLEASLTARDPISAIEIVRNGRVERAVPLTDWINLNNRPRKRIDPGMLTPQPALSPPGAERVAPIGSGARGDSESATDDSNVASQTFIDTRSSLGELTFDQSGWFLVRAITDNPKTFRFASTAPWYVEIGDEPRVSKASAQFFLDWVGQRMQRVKLDDPAQREAVLQYHRQAEQFWEKLAARANAE
jgi:hypothetical protein